MYELKRYSSEDLPLIKKYTKDTYSLSYYSQSANIEIWKDAKRYSFVATPLGLYVYSTADGYFLPPFSLDFKAAMKELELIAKENNVDFSVAQLTEEQVATLDPSYYETERDDSSDEYLYSREKLETLSGKHLQGKRNHIAQFQRKYPNYSLEPLAKENADDCLTLDWQWLETHTASSREERLNEYSSIKNAFASWDQLGLSGAMLRVDGSLVAFTIASVVGDEVVIFFEKADSSIHGSYAMINKGFLTTFCPPSSVVNRQEDLGIEGLRTAKQSYKPIKMIEKYRAKLR